MKQFFRGFAGRTFIAVLVAGLLYGGIIALPRYIEHRKTLPKQKVVAARSVVNENYLAYQSLATLDTDATSVGQALVSARVALDNSLKKLEELSNKPPKELPADTVTELKKLLDTQKKLLDDFDNRSKTFATAASYDPGDNLGLPIEANQEVLVNRAATAKNALQTLTQANALPIAQDTAKELNAMVACLENFERQVSSKAWNDASATRNQCKNNYTPIRKQLTQIITQPFRNDKASPEALKNISKELDQLITD